MSFKSISNYELRQVYSKETRVAPSFRFLPDFDMKKIGDAIRAGRGRAECTTVGPMLIEYEGDKVFVHPAAKGIFFPAGWFERSRFVH